MYQAEGTAGLLAAVTDEKLSIEYDSLMTIVFEEIESLKSLSKIPDMIDSLDSLSLLLKKKQANALEMAELMKNTEKNTIKEITQITISSLHDLGNANLLTTNEVHIQQDTAIVFKEKKKFIKRLKDAFKSNVDTLTQITSSSISTIGEIELPIRTDTVVKFMKKANLAAAKKNSDIIRQLVQRQNELHLMNELTGLKIRQIMDFINLLEYQNNLDALSERNTLLKKSTTFVATIGLSALVIALLFISWTLSSLNKGLRLQKSVQEGKIQVDNLLASREHLIYTITHDIKAPISSIMGFLNLMSDDNPSQKQQYYIENMNLSASHILDLVKNLLDFQSLEKNKPQLSLMSFPLYSFINDIYESFLPLAEKNQLKLSIHSNINQQNKYLSDPYRIRQILNNLISNAIKFTPENGTVSISASLIGQDILQVSVKDTGPGIDDNDKVRIFEEFTRLENTNKSVEGSGLGLTISRKLATLLGGEITLESEKDKGADFILTIPVSPFIEESISGYRTDSPAISSDKIRILFIDDDTIQLNLVSELMKKAGLAYTCCSKSAEALKLLQKETFSMIFTDIQMPDIKGFELVKKIRKSSFSGAATIPVIGLSADDKWQENHKDTGFTDFISKPFKSKQLLGKIEQYSNRKIQLEIKHPDRFDYNFDALTQFVSDDRIVALKMIDSFIEETDKNLVLLKFAIQKKDWSTIEELSHKMSSLMKMISAHEIVSILILFEKGSQSEEKAVTLCRLIEKIINEAKAARKKMDHKSQKRNYKSQINT
jgi:signal transduction histidine kinase/DNA-binding response OmpR family regulator